MKSNFIIHSQEEKPVSITNETPSEIQLEKKKPPFKNKGLLIFLLSTVLTAATVIGVYELIIVPNSEPAIPPPAVTTPEPDPAPAPAPPAAKDPVQADKIEIIARTTTADGEVVEVVLGYFAPEGNGTNDLNLNELDLLNGNSFLQLKQGETSYGQANYTKQY